MNLLDVTIPVSNHFNNPILAAPDSTDADLTQVLASFPRSTGSYTISIRENGSDVSSGIDDSIKCVKKNCFQRIS